MADDHMNQHIAARGKEFFASISGEAPSIFNKGWWTGKVMDWAMQNENFKVQLFRFVDVLPYLNTGDSLNRHIQEYFAADNQDIPAVMKWGAKGATGIGGKLASKVMSKTIRANIEGMAKQFIIGENTKQALKTLARLRKDNFAFTIDILGEASVNEAEAEQYMQSYLDLLEGLTSSYKKWNNLDSTGELDWGHAPRINISVKPSCLFSQAHPSDFEGSVTGICERVIPIFRKVREMGGHLCIDMEQYAFKDITLECYRRIRSSEEFREYPHLTVVLQSYLKDTDSDLSAMLEWARNEGLPISIRLVKGAYWDYETVIAKQNGWDIPVYVNKPESDIAFERQAATILENHDICHFACGSHNIRTVSAVMETATKLGVPGERYEFQILYGMAEPVRKGLLNVAKRVRLYAPYGDLLPGMAYLVRRLLENTANESFLRQSFAEEAEIERLLEDPAMSLERELKNKPAKKQGRQSVIENEPFADFTKKSVRDGFPEAIAKVRAECGQVCPLFIGGREVFTDDRMDSVNPADPLEIIGQVCQAGQAEIDMAMGAAATAMAGWRDTSPKKRAELLLRAADIARKNIFELSAWQVLEVGKQWDQAYADVGEGIDFMEYYAKEMLRLGPPRRMGNAPGEVNDYFYQGKGIAAVIGPWNFPFAISAGMTTAALVAGNCVLYKPAGPSSMIGSTLARVLREAGVPDGVFNFVPGRSSVMGDYLVEQPTLSMVAFTGSKPVGLRIIEKAAKVQEGQKQIKKVVAELGGKNAIIVDDDADLDEAVRAIIYSAFAYQGQKCSACSRVIVLEPIYEKFVRRLKEAALSLAIGSAEDPANYMGPVVSEEALEKIKKCIGIAKQEGEVLVCRDDIDVPGYYAPLTIVENIRPEHTTAREEIFGPVLAVMKVRDFDQAIGWANATDYALTGAVFTRSPKNLEKARKEFRVGNLYLNKGSTGAIVERQSFGGFNMSGIGSKTGGPDYLVQFMDPRVVTENTMRRGFTPIEEGDDWVV